MLLARIYEQKRPLALDLLRHCSSNQVGSFFQCPPSHFLYRYMNRLYSDARPSLNEHAYTDIIRGARTRRLLSLVISTDAPCARSYVRRIPKYRSLLKRRIHSQ